MGSERPMPGRCGAKAKNGGYCLCRTAPGQRCRMHGGLKRDKAGNIIDKRVRSGLYSKQLNADDREEYERLCRADPAEAVRESLVRVLLLAREMERMVRPSLEAAAGQGDAAQAADLLERISGQHREISKRYEAWMRATDSGTARKLTVNEARQFAEEVARAAARAKCACCGGRIGDLASREILRSLYPAEDLAKVERMLLSDGAAGPAPLPRDPTATAGVVQVVDVEVEAKRD